MTAADALLSELIDYAGLFPPAALSMREAMENYARYRADPAAPALGRFIVPFTRIEELEKSGNDLFPRGPDSDPWRLSVLLTGDVRAAAEQLLRFNCHHWSGSDAGHAVVDAVELKASSPADIAALRAEIPKAFTPYFEVPLGEGVEDLVAAVAKAGARAKIRTGGVTTQAFPAPSAVLAFLTACLDHKVLFKATAGLHHPLRAKYPLTYEKGSESAVMYGFLNVFLAAAFLAAKGDRAAARSILEESDSDAIRFDGEWVTWRQKQLTRSELRDTRERFAVSFGSCSFREPVDELRDLQLARAG